MRYEFSLIRGFCGKRYRCHCEEPQATWHSLNDVKIHESIPITREVGFSKLYSRIKEFWKRLDKSNGTAVYSGLVQTVPIVACSKALYSRGA